MALEDGVAVRTADADEVTRQVVLEALALALHPFGYHPTGTYDLDRPAWELCHIKALRQRDPEPSWYDAQAHDAWLEREQRRKEGEALWGPVVRAQGRSTP